MRRRFADPFDPTTPLPVFTNFLALFREMRIMDIRRLAMEPDASEAERRDTVDTRHWWKNAYTAAGQGMTLALADLSMGLGKDAPWALEGKWDLSDHIPLVKAIKETRDADEVLEVEPKPEHLSVDMALPGVAHPHPARPHANGLVTLRIDRRYGERLHPLLISTSAEHGQPPRPWWLFYLPSWEHRRLPSPCTPYLWDPPRSWGR